MRFLDLSGYAFTGKHAVIDFMREIRGAHVEHFAFEFGLLRMPGGLHDLEHALCGDWSPVRSDAAVRRFKQLVTRLGVANDWRRPSSLFQAVGWNYDRHYRGRFLPLSEAYIAELLTATWRADWPYPLATVGGDELFARKILSKLRVRRAMDFQMYLARPAEFLPATQRFLEAVLTSNVAPDTTTVVLHNAFEPFAPVSSFKFFEEARSIVVDRDPRDNYVQRLGDRSTGADVATFIQRYRLYREAALRTPHPRVLRMQFEDLVLDYEATRDRILAFLGEPAEAHVRPLQHFNPAKSRKNVGLYRAHPKPEEISRIERELPEFCDPRA